MKRYAVVLLFITSYALAVPMPEKERFYVYQDAHSQLNHYVGSGWMGAYGDLKMTPQSKMKPAEGESCMEISYSAKRSQDQGWAGIYWQNPVNNWGDKKGGYNLSKFRSLHFKVKGLKGGEQIDKFFVGGITGQKEEGDSDQVNSEPITLTKDWKEVVLDLKGFDLSHIIGGFGFAVNADSNPDGVTFYLDEIYFE